MSSLPFSSLPEWQTKHLLARIGSTSFSYRTGAVRVSLTSGIGASLASFFSWPTARTGTSRMNKANRRMSRSGQVSVDMGSILGLVTGVKGVQSSQCRIHFRVEPLQVIRVQITFKE